MKEKIPALVITGLSLLLNQETTQAWEAKNIEKYYQYKANTNQQWVEYQKKRTFDECRRKKRLRAYQIIQGQTEDQLSLDPCARTKVIRGFSTFNNEQLRDNSSTGKVSQLNARCQLPNSQVIMQHSRVINDGRLEGSLGATQLDLRQCEKVDIEQSEVINRGQIRSFSTLTPNFQLKAMPSYNRR